MGTRRDVLKDLSLFAILLFSLSACVQGTSLSQGAGNAFTPPNPEQPAPPVQKAPLSCDIASVEVIEVFAGADGRPSPRPRVELQIQVTRGGSPADTNISRLERSVSDLSLLAHEKGANYRHLLNFRVNRFGKHDVEVTVADATVVTGHAEL